MKIAFLLANYGSGGAERTVSYLSEFFAANQHQVEIVVLNGNVFFGNNCIILPGVTIGDNVVIGAGSVVTKDIPSNTVAAGVPARVIKTIEEYYNGLKDYVDYTKNLNYQEKREYLHKKYDIE